MKKSLLLVAVVFAFSSNHGQTKDPALQEALNGNYKKAFSMFKNRCEKKDGYACGMVGYFLDKGIGGIEKNHQTAINYYKKGCELNDTDSCTLLGYNEYKKGNLKEAKKLLKKACNLGNKDACNYLGKL